jgi:hypothetical protein
MVPITTVMTATPVQATAVIEATAPMGAISGRINMAVAGTLQDMAAMAITGNKVTALMAVGVVRAFVIAVAVVMDTASARTNLMAATPEHLITAVTFVTGAASHAGVIVVLCVTADTSEEVVVPCTEGVAALVLVADSAYISNG